MNRKKLVTILLIAVLASAMLTGNMLTMFLFAAGMAAALYYMAWCFGYWFNKPVNINTNLVVGVGIFALSLFYFSPLIFNGFYFESDAAGELAIYQNLLTQGFSYRGDHTTPWLTTDSLLHAAFLTTRVPAFLQPIVHIEPLFWYRIFLGIVLSLAPVVLFLMVKRATQSTLLALSVVAIFMLQIYFTNGFSYVRVVIGVALYFGLLWLLMKWRPSWQYYFATALIILAMVQTYYAAPVVAIIVLGGALLMTLIFDRKSTVKLAVATACLVLLFTTGFIQFKDVKPVRAATEIVKASAIEATGGTTFVHGRDRSVADWGSREEVVQQAFGKGLGKADLQYKINWALNWVVILGISFITMIGLWARRDWLSILGISHFALLVVAVILPTPALVWGIARFWFISAPVMLASGLRVITQPQTVLEKP